MRAIQAARYAYISTVLKVQCRIPYHNYTLTLF